MSKVLMNNSEIHQYLPKVLQHKKLCEQLNALYEKKNHDYGDSFHKTFVEEGLAMPRIRLSDKLSRFNTLSRGDRQQVSDESIRDTLIDLANYALMTVMELDLEKIVADSGVKAKPVDEKAASYDRPVKIGICFNTTFDADQTLQVMEAEINHHGFVTIATLSNYIGLHNLVEPDGPDPNHYGWTDLQSVRKCQTMDGAMVYFPEAISIGSFITPSSNARPYLEYTDGQPLPKKGDASTLSDKSKGEPNL